MCASKNTPQLGVYMQLARIIHCQRWKARCWRERMTPAMLAPHRPDFACRREFRSWMAFHAAMDCCGPGRRGVTSEPTTNATPPPAAPPA